MSKSISLETWRSMNPGHIHSGKSSAGMITLNRSPHGNKKHRDQFVAIRGGVYDVAKLSYFDSNLDIPEEFMEGMPMYAKEFGLKSLGVIDNNVKGVLKGDAKMKAQAKVNAFFESRGHYQVDKSEIMTIYRGLVKSRANYNAMCDRKKLAIRHRIVIR